MYSCMWKETYKRDVCISKETTCARIMRMQSSCGSHLFCILTKETYTYMKRNQWKIYVYKKTGVKEMTCTGVLRACGPLVDRNFFIIWQKRPVYVKGDLNINEKRRRKDTYIYPKRRLARDSCAHAIHSWIAPLLYHQYTTILIRLFNTKRRTRGAIHERTSFLHLCYTCFSYKETLKRGAILDLFHPFEMSFGYKETCKKGSIHEWTSLTRLCYTFLLYKETYKRGAIQEGWCLGPLVYVF